MGGGGALLHSAPAPPRGERTAVVRAAARGRAAGRAGGGAGREREREGGGVGVEVARALRVGMTSQLQELVNAFPYR